MTKNVRTGSRVVNFVSRYQGTNTYAVYNRDTGETSRINRSDAGEFARTAAVVSAEDIEAVMAFIEAEAHDYAEWRVANAHLFA